MDDVYMGGVGANKFVAKVRDYITDTETFTTYKVISLNADYTPNTIEIRPSYMTGIIPSSDVVFGSLSGLDSVGYLVYLDKTTMPYTLNVDTHLLVTHPDAAYAKVFHGSDTTLSGEVISRIYDGSNNFVTDNVPLASIAVNNHTNIAVKTLMTCKTTKNMMDRDMVTVVIYTAGGTVVDKKICFVENTGFIRDLNSAERMISHIELISGLMSSTTSFQVDAPIGMELSAINFECKVWYTDGFNTTLPIDGNKVALYGLADQSATIEGHTTGLSLRYKLGASEQTTMITGGVGANRSITQNYRIKVTATRPSSTVKLFAFPEWDSVNLRYNLRWFMTSLDRVLWRDVTNQVVIVTPIGGFDGTLMNAVQNLSVQLNLFDVSAVFDNLIISQTTSVTLRDITNAVPWVVKHKNFAGQPEQSGNIRAIRVSSSSINLGSGAVDLPEWLTRFYLNSAPLLNTSAELTPPTPTHFRVYKRNGSVIAPITSHLTTANWDDNVSVAMGVGQTLDINKSLTVVFYREASMGNYIELGLAHVLIKAS